MSRRVYKGQFIESSGTEVFRDGTLSVDLDTNKLYIHDGVTPGGVELSIGPSRTPVPLVSLGSAVTAGVGARAFINDSSVPAIVYSPEARSNFGASAVGNGIYVVPVWSNGEEWLIG